MGVRRATGSFNREQITNLRLNIEHTIENDPLK